MQTARIVWLMAAVAAAAATAAPVLAAEPVGEASRVFVYAYQTPQGAERASLYEREQVFGDAVVETVSNGGLELTFLDGSKLTVGSASSVTLDEFVYDPAAGSGSAAVQIARGAFRFVSGAMPDDKVKIETPTMVIGIRGTVLNGTLFDAGGGAINCLEGEIEVTSKQTQQSVTVPAGNHVLFDRAGNLTPQSGQWFYEDTFTNGPIDLFGASGSQGRTNPPSPSGGGGGNDD